MAISKRGVIAFRLLLLLALVVNTYLTTTELAPMLEQVNDKLGHILAYFTLALFADGAFPSKSFSWHKWVPLMLYGLGIELIQSQIPYRQFSGWDLVANGGGLVLYGLIRIFAGRNLFRQ